MTLKEGLAKAACSKCGAIGLVYYDGALGFEGARCPACGHVEDLNADANARATRETTPPKCYNKVITIQRNMESGSTVCYDLFIDGRRYIEGESYAIVDQVREYLYGHHAGITGECAEVARGIEAGL